MSMIDENLAIAFDLQGFWTLHTLGTSFFKLSSRLES